MSVRRLAEKQPPSFAFAPANLEWAKAQIAKYPPGRQQSAVIPILWRAQQQAGGAAPLLGRECPGNSVEARPHGLLLSPIKARRSAFVVAALHDDAETPPPRCIPAA